MSEEQQPVLVQETQQQRPQPQQQQHEQEPPKKSTVDGDDTNDSSAGHVIIIKNSQTDPLEQDIEYYLFSKKMPFDIYSVLYSLIVAIGGIMGYALKGSVPSITAGLIFAAVLLIGTYIEAKYRNHYLLVLASALLAGVMLYRSIHASKFMPAGPVAILATIMLARYSYFVYLRYQMQQKRQPERSQ